MDDLIPVKDIHQMFQFEGFQIRVIMIDGEPWFVVKDACEVLEIGNPSDAVRRLDDDEVDSIEVIDSLGRTQLTNIVNEPGLYSLILGSRKPISKRFKRWVTHDVIPSIRKTGSYSVQPVAPQIPSFTKIELLEMALAAEKKLLVVTVENETMKPKAKVYDQFISGENAQLLSHVAKVLGINQKCFFEELRSRKILLSGPYHNLPAQKYINLGYFVVTEKPHLRGRSKWNSPQTKVTPLGIEYLAREVFQVLEVTD